jgi:hypothetical protein
MLTMTWNSDLLSKGSIFSTTHLTPTRLTASRIAIRVPRYSRCRLRRALASLRNGDIRRWNSGSSGAVS